MNGYPNIFCQKCGGDPEGGFCYCTSINPLMSILCTLKVEVGPSSKRHDRMLAYAIRRLREAGGELPGPERASPINPVATQAEGESAPPSATVSTTTDNPKEGQT